MFFQITENGLKEIAEEAFWERKNTVALITEDTLEQSQAFGQFCRFSGGREHIRLCRIECDADSIYVVMCIPAKGKNQENERCSLYVTREKILFISYVGEEGTIEKADSSLTKIIKDIARQQEKKGYSREYFLYDVLCGLIAKDLQYMEKLEKGLSVLEEEVFHGGHIDFNSSMLSLKKRIFRFYRYYSQLIEIGNQLEENENKLLAADETIRFDRYKEKAERLAAETQVLREYAMQVQEVYQSEIGIRQNNIMKILTTVTTIFLPLTLIAGWYGMNFAYMPELSWKYGYALVAGVSAAVFLLLLWVFRRKGFW